MRIDKFLKNSRIIKRRTVAKEACEQGRITVNDKVAKPGTEVKAGDEIYIQFGNGSLRVKVTELKDSCRKEDEMCIRDRSGAVAVHTVVSQRRAGQVLERRENI